MTCILGLAATILVSAGFAIFGSPVIGVIDSKTIADRTISAMIRLPDRNYLLVGGHSIGEQPWETEPSVSFYGGTAAENTFTVDGLSVSNISEGTVSSVAYEFVEEVQIQTSGYEAEYGGAMSAVLDYRHGGTNVVNIVTKSGGNEFGASFYTRLEESLEDLAYAEDGTLWGAGTVFDPEPTPVLGHFNIAGEFVRADNPLGAQGGFLNGVEIMDVGLAFGHTVPGGDPTKPLLIISQDSGRTWEAPPSLPWNQGTINTAAFLDPLNGWVAGETPGGAAFAHTQDGGNSWMKQTMPDVTYIWDVEIAWVWPACEDLGTLGDPLSTPYISEPLILGAALGTHYLNDGSKESIVFRTLDGQTWEELWRVDGYGGDLHFDDRIDGEVAIVQNGLDGDATFSRYAAHDFFGAENLIVCGEIIYESDTVYTDEPLTLQLAVRGPWGGRIAVDTVVWATDFGDLVVDPDDPMLATFTASQPMDVTVTCTLPDRDVELGRRFQVKLKN